MKLDLSTEREKKGRRGKEPRRTPNGIQQGLSKSPLLSRIEALKAWVVFLNNVLLCKLGLYDLGLGNVGHLTRFIFKTRPDCIPW